MHYRGRARTGADALDLSFAASALERGRIHSANSSAEELRVWLPVTEKTLAAGAS
jgi:hypothetical protein